MIYHLASTIGTSNTFSSVTNAALASLTEQYDVGAGESTMGVYTGTLAAGGASGTLAGTQGNALGMYVGFAIKSTTSAPLSFGARRLPLLGAGR